MYFSITSFGCRVNQYEGNAVAAAMQTAGFELTDSQQTAQIIIINTCTVTGKSDDKVIRLISSLRKSYPRKLLVLIGCFAQAFPEKASALPVNIITGSADKANLPFLILDFLKNYNNDNQILSVCETPGTFEELPFSIERGNTRRYLKIEDGCDRHCSYCIIPVARGAVRSRSLSQINEEAKKLSDLNCREIVLTGINLSRYGSDIGLSLCDAVEAVSAIENISRVRLSSLEPQILERAVIKRLAENSKFCPHFHLSLQSGSDETLKRMNRGYTSAQYFEIVNEIRKQFNNPGITTDIMVGFPGETKEEFEASFTFIEKLGFSKIHVFTYSPREGTPAAKNKNQINGNIKRQRYKEMSALSDKLRKKFLISQIETVQKVIIEKRTSREYIAGHTGNYTPVKMFGTHADRGTELKVKITGTDNDCCIGEVK